MGRTACWAAAVFAACVLFAFAEAEPAGATLPGVNGRIAISGSEIQTVRPDGTGVLRLTYNESYDYGPSWSPDGERLAFVSSRGQNTHERGRCGEIWTMGADGSNPVRLTNVGRGRFCVQLGEPAFSPDGSKIAFTSNDGKIYTINADGTDLTRITNGGSSDDDPTWSPDGQRIAFSSNRFPGRDPDYGYTQNDYDILTTNLDGTDVVRVTDSDLDEVSPDWSPDGRELVFVGQRIDRRQGGYTDYSNDIFRAAADGSGRETQLTDDGYYEWEPIWAPDGAKIAYESTRKLKIMNADGTGKTTTSMAANGDMSWSPAPDTTRSPRPALPAVEFVKGVPGYYDTNGSPGDVRSADLDGDGHADLVVELPLPETVAVFEGNGDGTFDAGVQYGTGIGGDVEIADFNGDGIEDLVVGESVLLGTGTGSFGQTMPYESGGGGSNVTVADFDGDGRQDIATTDGSNSTFPANKLLVVLGGGDGTFGPPSSFPLEGLPFDMESGDVDGDGDADLVGANEVFGTVSVLFNGGDGTFGKQSVLPAAPEPGEVEVADFDGDGNQDIAVAHYNSMGASVLLGRGGGAFETPKFYPTRAPKPTYLGVADIDGSGGPDLVVGNQEFGALSTLLNYGDGTFRSDREGATNTSTGSVHDAAISDFDEDGRPDVAYVGRIGPGFNVVLNRTGPVRPTAAADSYASDEDTTLNIPAPGVLDNDAGVAGRGELVAVKATGPQRGTLDLRPDGSFSYTPEANWAGTDTFTYTACQRIAPRECSQAVSVKIDHEPVNDAPTVADRRFSAVEDTALTVGPGEGLRRDARDPEANGMGVEIVRDVPAGDGDLTLDSASYGSFTFAPAGDFAGTTSFAFRVCDGGALRACSQVRTATIDVAPVNDAPAAQKMSVSTPADAPREITLSATDAEGDAATFDIPQDGGPTNGSLGPPSDIECADAAPKTCTAKVAYTPDGGYNGRDAFSYTASDRQAQGQPATVKIAVGQANDAPVANGDSYSVAEDSKLEASVLGNDTDPENDPLTARVDRAPNNGTLNLNPDGSFAYAPNPNFNGSDSFEYSICDDGEPRICSGPATVDVSVDPVNDAPVARGTSVAVDEDGRVDVNAFVNDSDADGDALAMRYSVYAPYGKATCTAAGACTYTPNPDFNGEDSFHYTVTDNNGGTAEANVYLTVRPVNDVPVAGNDAYSVTEDQPLRIDTPGVLTNDADVDGHRLRASLESGPSDGTAELLPDGSFVYTPNQNFNGQDSFTYRANDGRVPSRPATVTVTVDPADEPVDEPDLAPPDTSVSSGPNGFVGSRSAAFGFASTEEGGTFECSLDGAAYSPCSPPQAYSELGDGEHSFRVRAIDAAGNADATPAERSWTVDTTRPTIGSASPAGGSSTRDRTPLVRATITDSRTDLTRDDVELYLDGRRVTGFSYDGTTDRLRHTPSRRLSYGPHVLEVRAQDATGNVVTKSWSFRVIR